MWLAVVSVAGGKRGKRVELACFRSEVRSIHLFGRDG